MPTSPLGSVGMLSDFIPIYFIRYTKVGSSINDYHIMIMNCSPDACIGQ